MKIVFSTGRIDTKRKHFALEKGNVMCNKESKILGEMPLILKRMMKRTESFKREENDKDLKNEGIEKYPENLQRFSVVEGNHRKAEKSEEVQKEKESNFFIPKRMSWMSNRRD